MTQDPLLVAKAKIAEHRAEIARLEQFVEMYVTLSGSQASSEAKRDQGLSKPLSAVPAPPVQRAMFAADARFSSTSEIIDAAIGVLRASGVAMSAAGIYEELIARGIRIAGQKPKANLTAKFATRKHQLRYTEKTGKWSLVEWEPREPWIGARGAPATNREPGEVL